MTIINYFLCNLTLVYTETIKYVTVCVYVHTAANVDLLLIIKTVLTPETFTVLICCAILFKNLFHDGLLNNFLSIPPSSLCDSLGMELALVGLVSLSWILFLLEVGFVVPKGLRGSVKVRFNRDPSTCFGVIFASETSFINSLSEQDFITEVKLLVDIIVSKLI